jgi:SagB-type dehydrogenase family enzyme
LRRILSILISLIASIIIVIYVVTLTNPYESVREQVVVEESVIELPYPRVLSNITVEEAILKRRSIRDYADQPILIEHLSLILWSAQGITDPRLKFRAAPSAGATYPLEVYVVIGERGVLIRDGYYLKPGIYRYDPLKHVLVLVREGEFRDQLASAALDQKWVREAPISIVITAVFERTTRIYGERGASRYVPMEVGHVSENIYLVATALGYGTVAVGAFNDNEVASIIGLEAKETPMYIMPIGVPKQPVKTSFEDLWVFIEESRRGS